MMRKNTKIVKSVITAALLLLSSVFALPAAASSFASFHIGNVQISVVGQANPYHSKFDYGHGKGFFGTKFYIGKKRFNRNRIQLRKKHFRHGNRHFNKRRAYGHNRFFNRGHGKFRRSHRFHN